MHKILFRLVIGFSTFLLGLSFFYGWYWFQTKSESKKLMIAENIAETQLNRIQTVNLIPTAESTSDEKPDYTEEGFYYIIGESPKAFKDFNEFYFEFTEYDEKKEDFLIVPPKGYVFLNESDEIKFKQVFFGNNQLSFETEKLKGVSYKFIGKFAEKGYYLEDDFVRLEGLLTKFKDGKKVAEGNFKFGWYVDGC